MPVVLPRRFRFAHDYAIFLHDLVVGAVQGGIDAGIFNTTIPLTEAQAEVFTALRGEALYAWLEKNVDESILLEGDFKMLVKALLIDFCHNILEALNASKKGKLTVAFTLLRKPLQDNLFYLEWMLADLPDFLDRFRKRGPLEVSAKDLTVEKRREIIRRAIGALTDPHSINPDFLYDVRFNRAEPYSLAGLSDKAIHLITTNRHLLTEPQNFNFIFSGPAQFESQWQSIYMVVPQLLYHAVRVIDELLSQIGSWDKGWGAWIRVRRESGLLLYMDSLVETSPESVELAREMLRRLLKYIAPGCPQCGVELPLHVRNMRSLCVHARLRCPTCKDTVQFEFSSVNSD